MRGWDSRRAMKKAELLTRACSAAAPPKALLKRVAAIQHCFKTRELTGKGCLLLATNRGKSTDWTNWEGGKGRRGPSMGSVANTTSFINRTTVLSTFAEPRL